MKFCPKCGKKTKELYDNLCRDCSAENLKLFDYTQKDITQCVSCDTMFDGRKRHMNKSRNEIINEIIRNRLTFSKRIIDPVIDIQLDETKHHIKQGAKIKSKFILHISGQSESKVHIDEEYDMPLTIRYITCENCSKKNTNYYEGILQIRHDDKDKVEKVINALHEIMIPEEKRSVFVTSISRSKRGADAYVTSQKHIKEIGKKLFDEFGGELKINEQIFTRDKQKSKHLYRVNVLIRLPDYELGSIVKINKKLILIKRIKGYFLIGKELTLNKNITISSKDEEVELISTKENLFPTTITTIRPQVEVLNPKTYQSDIVQNKLEDKEYKIGQKVKVFIHNKGIWIV